MRVFAWLRAAGSVGVTLLVTCMVPAVASADPIVEFHTDGAFSLGSLQGRGGVAASVYGAGQTLGLGGRTLGAGETAVGVGDPTMGINTFLVYHEESYTFDIRDTSSPLVDRARGGEYVWSHRFGYFTIESFDPNGAATRDKYREFDGAEFTLTLTQVRPDVPTDTDGNPQNTGQFSSKLIHGTVWYCEDGDSQSQTGSFLGVRFSEPYAFSVPRTGETSTPLVYTIERTVQMNNPAGQIGQQFSVRGQVSTVVAPLPGVAWVGLSLLGGIGTVRGVKRFFGSGTRASGI